MWVQPKGATALLDAVYFAIQQMKKAHNPRKALIIISDGGDNRSRYSIGDLKSLLREAEVQIYAIGIFEPIVRPRASEELEGPNMLREITEQSGGRSFEIAHLNQLTVGYRSSWHQRKDCRSSTPIGDAGITLPSK